MEILNKNELIDTYDAFMCNRNKLKKEGNEIAVCFNREHKVFNYINNIEMKEQLKSWRKMIKQKQIEILHGNNLKLYDLRGRPFFIFVITPTDEKYNMIDPFGMLLNYMVSGFIYAFDSEKNRNECYNYLNKIQTKMSNETD
jgi:hypothetical protein